MARKGATVESRRHESYSAFLNRLDKSDHAGQTAEVDAGATTNFAERKGRGRVMRLTCGDSIGG